MKSILIVGGAGFAGLGLAKRLMERGDRVKVLDIMGKNQTEYLGVDVEYAWKAVHDISLGDVMGFDIVIDLAAQADVPMGFTSPKWTCYENVYGTLCLFEVLKDANIDRVLVAGSGNEYGRPKYLPIDEEHPLTPHNPYAWSKACQEMCAWAYQRCYDVPVTVMSNGCVSGPGMRREIFIFKWLWNILQGLPIVLEGGTQTRDLTYVDDVLDAWMLAIDAPRDVVVGEKWQVSYGDERRVIDILDLCLQEGDMRTEVIHRPHRPGEDGQRELFATAKARELLGYEPKIGVEENIKLTAEWIRGLLQ